MCFVRAGWPWPMCVSDDDGGSDDDFDQHCQILNTIFIFIHIFLFHSLDHHTTNFLVHKLFRKIFLRSLFPHFFFLLFLLVQFKHGILFICLHIVACKRARTHTLLPWLLAISHGTLGCCPFSICLYLLFFFENL